MVDLSKFCVDQSTSERWTPRPRPLCEDERPDPYPVDWLPSTIRDAIVEVAEYAQAPHALIAASALSAVSAAIQTRFSVQRDAALSGPASLFLLTVAVSGERKSFVDSCFAAPLIEWQARQRQEHKRLMAQYKLDLAAWEASRPESGDLEHEMLKPDEPRRRRVLRGDDTPEALARALADYPVAVLNSAEAGIVFGSHGMNAESAMRNLGQANIMWDGGVIDRDRVGTGELHVEGMRVTMGLQVQPHVLEHFMQKQGGLARGIGYLARFLFSRPASTQGTRYYKEPPENQPALTAFKVRMAALLDLEPEFDEFDRLLPQYLRLSEKAYETWIGFHNEVEEQLSGEEQYANIKDVASKAAENAARLACCLHAFEGDANQPIGVESILSASQLMRWYLAEAARFGRVSTMAPEVADAQTLEEWLVRDIKRRGLAAETVVISVNDVRKKGPNKLRNPRGRVEAALEILADHGRAQIVKRTGLKGYDIIVAAVVFKEYCQ